MKKYSSILIYNSSAQLWYEKENLKNVNIFKIRMLLE